MYPNGKRDGPTEFLRKGEADFRYQGGRGGVGVVVGTPQNRGHPN